MEREMKVDFGDLFRLGLTIGEPVCISGCHGATGGLALDMFTEREDPDGRGKEYVQARILFAGNAPDTKLQCIVLHNSVCEQIEIHELARHFLASVAFSVYEQKLIPHEICFPSLSAMNLIARAIEDDDAAVCDFQYSFRRYVEVMKAMGCPKIVPGRSVL